jgi:hypothetical protein
VCDWKREAIECGLRASSFKPGGVLVRECDDDQLVRRKGAKRVLDRFDRSESPIRGSTSSVGAAAASSSARSAAQCADRPRRLSTSPTGRWPRLARRRASLHPHPRAHEPTRADRPRRRRRWRRPGGGEARHQPYPARRPMLQRLVPASRRRIKVRGRNPVGCVNSVSRLVFGIRGDQAGGRPCDRARAREPVRRSVSGQIRVGSSVWYGRGCHVGRVRPAVNVFDARARISEIGSGRKVACRPQSASAVLAVRPRPAAVARTVGIATSP